jgi:hypothetical protein
MEMIVFGTTGTFDTAKKSDSVRGTEDSDDLFGGIDRAVYRQPTLTEQQIQDIGSAAGFTEQVIRNSQNAVDMSWAAWLVEPPVFEPVDDVAWERSNAFKYRYHPGAANVYRSDTAEPEDGALFPDAGQQATYDVAHRLITHGPGAGTPDLVSPDINSFGSNGHQEWDVEPFNALRRLAREDNQVDAWENYHQLGWTPTWPSGAPENWGPDGNDRLFGNGGEDTYRFMVGGGKDRIFDEGFAGEKDTLVIYGGGWLDSIEEDIAFSIHTPFFSRGRADLVVGIQSPDGSVTDAVTIEGMQDPSRQVEELVLLDRGENPVDVISLTQEFLALTNKPQDVDPIAGDQTTDEGANTPPVVNATSQVVEVGEYANASSWLSASDSDGDAINWWAVWDYDPAASSGEFLGDGYAVDGSAIEDTEFPAAQAIRLSADELASLEYGGADKAGTEYLAATAWDGDEWGKWTTFEIVIA